MAIGILDGVSSPDKGVVALFGTLTMGADSAVTSQDCDGFSVAKDGTTDGQWVVTFDHRWNKFLNMHVTVDSQGTENDLVPQVETGYSSTTGTLKFVLLAATTKTNPTSGNLIHLTFFMKKGSV